MIFEYISNTDCAVNCQNKLYMKLSTIYQKRRRKLTKLLPFPGKTLPKYPNSNLPDIPRDLEKFENLLNMFGFFSKCSTIEEIGTYDKNFLQLSMNDKGELNAYFTFSPILFQTDKIPLQISYTLILNENGSAQFLTDFIYNLFSNNSVEHFPNWERYFDLQFNALKAYINNNKYSVYDELFQRFQEEEKLRTRDAALIQLLS